MAESASFANFLQGAREKKKNEALAQQFLGARGRTGSTPGAGSGAKSRNAPEKPEKPTLLSRISGGAGVQKRSSSAKPAGNIDGKWQHDLHKVNNPGKTARPDRPASASQIDRNNRTYNKFQSSLGRNANVRNDDAPGFNIKGVASGGAGPFTVIASNFAPGTTAADIEAVMAPHGGETLGCRLLTSSPTVMVELQFANRDGAQNVIATFNNQKADGRTLYVYMKETQVAKPAPHSRPLAGRGTQVFDDMELDTSAGARGGSFQDGRYGFTDSGPKDLPRGPRRRY